MPPAAATAPVATVDELIRLTRELQAQRPRDPEVAVLVRQIAAASGNPFWQQIAEQLLREPAAGAAAAAAASDRLAFLRPVGAFLRTWVWDYLRTRGGVAIVTALVAAGGSWWAARETPMADRVNRAAAVRVFADVADEVKQLVGAEARPTPEEVQTVLDKHLAALQASP